MKWALDVVSCNSLNELARMKKSRQIPVLAWLVGAAIAAAALSSCAPQGQACSAYQQVQPVQGR